MKQSGFSDLEYNNKKEKTRKERFLAEMDAIFPGGSYWVSSNGTIQKAKWSTTRRFGNHATYLLYATVDWTEQPAMEDSLYDITLMRSFAGIAMNEIPDEFTILRFRHRLERNQLTEKLSRKTERYLSEQNLILSEGTIVDATILAAPSSTKNQDEKEILR